MDKIDNPGRLIKLVREITYYCEWCKRDIVAEHGKIIHDDVFHPADWTPDGGQHDN